MKKFLFLITILGSTFFSCTKEKTDYESEVDKPIVEEQGFKEVVVITDNQYKVSLIALNGVLHTGYNELRLTIELLSNEKKVIPTEVNFLPVYNYANELYTATSCPHSRIMDRVEGVDSYFKGYSVFTNATSPKSALDLFISFKVDGKIHALQQRVVVETQTNKNLSMKEFMGKDGEHYYLALIGPQKPKVGENNLIAGLYKYNQTSVDIEKNGLPNPDAFSFSTVNNYMLLLDPRMPDPSMGNHSSPNNKDLVQEKDGFYHGIVNYTMTGNWALNFILLNDKGQVQKGTVVPPDFTPGVEGVRSDLFIDILF